MAEVNITISGRQFAVACQDGEETYLTSAAAMLDAEATRLGPQAAQLTEARVLLMAGLMLADRTASVEDQLRDALEDKAASTPDQAAQASAQFEAAIQAKDAEIKALKSAFARAVERVETLTTSQG